MPPGYYRGMRTSSGHGPKIKGKYREPRAREAWPASKIFSGKRYDLDTVTVKKPLKGELSSKRKSKNVRVVSSKKPRFGHRVNVATGPIVGKHAQYSRHKTSIIKKKTKRRKK